MRKTAAIFSALLIATSGSSWGVEHLHPGLFPHHFKDKIHHPSVQQIRAAGSLRAASLASARGTKNIAVIIVQFTPGNASLTTGNHSIVSVSTIKNYMDQMAVYYHEASYGNLALQFKYFNSSAYPSAAPGGDPAPVAAGVYTLPHPMEYYGCGDEFLGCNGVATPRPGINANGNYLIADALTAVRNDHSNNPTNTTAGGIFDTVIVVHAGNGNETSAARGDIWSIFYSEVSGDDVQVISGAGGGWTEGDVVPETETDSITSSLGVICHEFGHELGLPDEYNTASESTVDGYWEIMDLGPYAGAGANPAHPGAWDRLFLKWDTPRVIADKASTTIGAVEAAAGNILKLPVPNNPNEYFLAEYRFKSSGSTFDKSIPGNGLLIWHIDDNIALNRGLDDSDPNQNNSVNTGQPHFGISIVSRDGLAIGGNPPGDANNAFTDGSVFTAPQSNNYANQPTSITLANIRGVGSATVGLDVVDFTVAASQAILRVINYPNPAGRGYAHPKGPGYTTLQFELTRPSSECQINIYTLSGDLVKKIGNDSFTYKGDRSGNNQWVYEYDWDLKNDDGKMVAPGVYFYLVRVEGKKSTGKLVVIR